jgi:hypothetical protein
MKAENPIELREEVDSSPGALNAEQRKPYVAIVAQYANEIDPGERPPTFYALDDTQVRSRYSLTLLITFRIDVCYLHTLL